jgi:hypothetical protein
LGSVDEYRCDGENGIYFRRETEVIMAKLFCPNKKPNLLKNQVFCTLLNTLSIIASNFTTHF